MEFVEYLYEKFIVNLPVVLLKPFSDDFFTDVYVLIWLFTFCCIIGYLFKCQSDIMDTQANHTQANSTDNNTEANNDAPAINKVDANDTQANDDSLTDDNTGQVNNSDSETETSMYNKNKVKFLTDRLQIQMEEIEISYSIV